MGEQVLPCTPSGSPPAASPLLRPYSGASSPHFIVVATPLPARFEQYVPALNSLSHLELSPGAGQSVPCHGNLARGRGEAGKTRLRCSYGCMIGMALRSSPTQTMLAKEIYAAIESIFPELRESPPKGWKNSVRHCLSLGQFFQKVTNGMNNNTNGGGWQMKKGFQWEVIPKKKEALNREIERFLRDNKVQGLPKSFTKPNASDHVSAQHKPAAVGFRSTATQCGSVLSPDVTYLQQGYQNSNSNALVVRHVSTTPVASGTFHLPETETNRASVCLSHAYGHIGPASPINYTSFKVHTPLLVDLPLQSEPIARSSTRVVKQPTIETSDTTTGPQILTSGQPLPGYQLPSPLLDRALPASSSVINPPPPPSLLNNATAAQSLLPSDLWDVECNTSLVIIDEGEWQAMKADLRPIPEDLYPPEIMALASPDKQSKLFDGPTPDPMLESLWQNWPPIDQHAQAPTSVTEELTVNVTAGCGELTSISTHKVEDNTELIEQFWRDQFSQANFDYEVPARKSAAEHTRAVEDLLSVRDLEELDIDSLLELLDETENATVTSHEDSAHTSMGHKCPHTLENEEGLPPSSFNACQTMTAISVRSASPDPLAVSSRKRKREDCGDGAASEDSTFKRVRLVPPSPPSFSHCSEAGMPFGRSQQDGCSEQSRVKMPRVEKQTGSPSPADLDYSVYSMLDAASVARLKRESRTQEFEAIFIDSEDILREMHSCQGL